jgi:hypothetical protein
MAPRASSSSWSLLGSRRRQYQLALYDAGIPATAFVTADIRADVERHLERGDVVRGEPVDVGTATVVAFEDTCDDVIQVVQPVG